MHTHTHTLSLTHVAQDAWFFFSSLFACFQSLEDWRRRVLDFKAKESEREKKKTWVVFTVHAGWAFGNSDAMLRWNGIGDKVVVGAYHGQNLQYNTAERSKAKQKIKLPTDMYVRSVFPYSRQQQQQQQ